MIISKTPFNFRYVFFFLGLIFLTSLPAQAAQLESPVLQVERHTVFWNSVPDATGYNIHLSDGTYITSTTGLVFDALEFYPLDRGGSLNLDIRVVSTNDSSWEFWGRSDIASIRYAASCLGCVDNAPSDVADNLQVTSTGLTVETYSNTCNLRSVWPDELFGVSPCVAICATGGIAIGGSCHIEGYEANTEDRNPVKLGTGSKLSSSAYECHLDTTQEQALTLELQVVVKCIAP